MIVLFMTEGVAADRTINDVAHCDKPGGLGLGVMGQSQQNFF